MWWRSPTGRVAGALLAVPLLVTAQSGNDDKENMNGEYLLSQTPEAHDTQARFPARYFDYPRGAIHFDVYSPPIRTLYSQVFWKGLEPVPLPEDIVKKFANKGMAVIGFEIDQVRRTPSGDVSVPLTVAYNHHFESHMIGKHAAFEKIRPTGADDPRIQHMKMGHGMPSLDEAWVVKDLGTSTGAIPKSQDFGAANGGEARKSFHGYAPGFAQVIDSPTEFQITPMQIDTWHREKMNVSHPTRFVPGPVPRSSLAPTSGPDALYSGLLECPLTTRIQKKLASSGHEAKSAGACAVPVRAASECFKAAEDVLGTEGTSFSFHNISDTSRPAGCSATSQASRPNSIDVYFNEAEQAPTCGASGSLAGRTESLVNVTLHLDVVKQVATITLVGPSDVWFGVGFNATAMKSRPWAIIVDGTGGISERKLQDQNPGVQLKQSVSVVSSSTADGQRTVVLTRPFEGLTPDHFSFSASADTILPFINAVGDQATLSYHKEKRPTSMSLLPEGSAAGAACICAAKPPPFGQGKGTLTYVRTSQPGDVGSGTISFDNNCAAQPRSDMLAQENPTCDLRTYVGGQIACHHMWSLLDADQEIPWADQPLEYHLKFRFWVQDYDALYHQIVQRTTWGIASPVEYDVPKCEEGMMGCDRSPDGSWRHTITGTYQGWGKLVAAHFHCHAPTCLSIAMYSCPLGTKICNATTGHLLCREEPVYGGRGKIDDPRFDEPGYILQPPCLWGSAEFGLQTPPDLSNVVLGSVKTSNATYGHHGEMAWQQVLLVNAKSTPGFFI